MRISKITDIDETNLLSSTISASTEDEFDYTGSTTYNTDDVVKVSYESDGTTDLRPIKEYTALSDTITSYPPDNPTEWQDNGATNKWKMFDSYLNTQTEESSIDTNIEVEITATNQNAVSLFQVDAKRVNLALIITSELATSYDMTSDAWTKGTGWSYDSVNDQYDCDGTQTAETELYQTPTIKNTIWYQIKFTVSNYSAGSVAGFVSSTQGTFVNANGTYTQIIAAGDTNKAGVVGSSDFVGSIDSISIYKVPKYESSGLSYYGIISQTSFWSYFFGEVNYVKDLIWYFPAYNTNAKLRVTVVPKTGETAKVGSCIIGFGTDLANTEYTPIIQVLDYSKFETDVNGRTYYSKGSYAKKVELQGWFLNTDLDAVRRILEEYVGTPIIFDGNNNPDTNYSSLIGYGIIRDQSITLPGPVVSRLDIEFRGLI